MINIEYLKQAYLYAKSNSTDLSTQNGAVLVKNDEIISYGANHFPIGVIENEERWQRPAKYNYVEHAERNVIYNCAKEGISTDGSILYCPWAACTDCMRAIITCGITDIVVHHKQDDEFRYGIKVSEMWINSIKISLTMMNEVGIKMHIVDDKLFGDDFSILFNGVNVNP
jgi:dCMP deaminase